MREHETGAAGSELEGLRAENQRLRKALEEACEELHRAAQAQRPGLRRRLDHEQACTNAAIILRNALHQQEKPSQP